MANLIALQEANGKRWKIAKLTGRLPVDATTQRLFSNKARYLKIVHMLQALGSNMPDEAWVFIAVTHERESGGNFNTHLGQGDPLTDRHGNPIKTVHVPAGRGPFTGPEAFENAAVDALWYCAPYAAKNNKDWSISGMLTYDERFNGLAYANVGRPSPYVWSDTTVYDPPTGPGGKVLVDHGPITSTVDKQIGVAALYLKIDALDDTINFGEMPDAPLQPTLPEPDKIPVADVYDAVWLQASLNRLGATPPLTVDGINGAATRTAVLAFQTSKGLTVDGRVGPLTIDAIKQAVAEISAAPVT
jgi:lysozyme family protein